MRSTGETLVLFNYRDFWYSVLHFFLSRGSCGSVFVPPPQLRTHIKKQKKIGKRRMGVGRDDIDTHRFHNTAADAAVNRWSTTAPSQHQRNTVVPSSLKVFHFDNELHAYLASCGIDDVKVDVQNIIEALGAGHGGRVSITRSYVQALEASIAKNFKDNGCIACMCRNTDGLYSAKQTAIIRASDDFYPHDPVSHTIHISSVAYNTLFLGEFMQPDWDMFHSLHPAADYHAAPRSIGGCAIYVSDKPGNHNFDLLKKMVLPDGSVLRAQLPGRPTLDCLFADPARDGISLLKIWNVNKCTGVVGVFNCQGAGWCKIEKKTRIHDSSPGILTGSVQSADVDVLTQVAGEDWNGETIVYCQRSGEVIRLPKGVSLPVTLKVLEYELFHFCPLKICNDWTIDTKKVLSLRKFLEARKEASIRCLQMVIVILHTLTVPVLLPLYKWLYARNSNVLSLIFLLQHPTC
ncbi:hypothetical protein L1887_22709 [Cichorium endivia]|nr:hypothetical protein L1887_22709 [Cichorium endivia]